jgi:uncharacterized protein (DUF3820 family)
MGYYAKGELIQMITNNDNPVLDFGIHRGKLLSDIPIDYVIWLALRGSYQEPGNRYGDAKWKCPITISILARREAENRGYKRHGDHYMKEE